MRLNTDQIEFWAGDFGNNYHERNAGNLLQTSGRMSLWAKIMAHINRWDESQPGAIDQILEVGAGLGQNLRILQRMYPDSAFRMLAVEPNAKARAELEQNGISLVGHSASLIEMPSNSVPLVFTSGVLIHISPERLGEALQEIHRVSSRWIVCIEYFSAQPTEIEYRGQKGLLWKRDYGSDYMNLFPNLQCRGYGFEWKPTTGLDNLTWWAFEKPTW